MSVACAAFGRGGGAVPGSGPRLRLAVFGFPYPCAFPLRFPERVVLSGNASFASASPFHLLSGALLRFGAGWISEYTRTGLFALFYALFRGFGLAFFCRFLLFFVFEYLVDLIVESTVHFLHFFACHSNCAERFVIV